MQSENIKKIEIDIKRVEKELKLIKPPKRN